MPEKILVFPDSLENRLGLAKWVTSKDNPLTARVAVNRYWKNIFGTGIVETVEDFGNQGELPSHPALLDWLAIQFMESGWDVKNLLKLMVMSNTYRQSSIISEEDLKRDKKNRLLARGPSKRLSGEMLRDNVLAASGLLNRTIGGKSVKPYQPEGLWKINGAILPTRTKGKSSTAGACIHCGNAPCPTQQSPPLTLPVARFALCADKKQTPLFKLWS